MSGWVRENCDVKKKMGTVYFLALFGNFYTILSRKHLHNTTFFPKVAIQVLFNAGGVGVGVGRCQISWKIVQVSRKEHYVTLEWPQRQCRLTKVVLNKIR